MELNDSKRAAFYMKTPGLWPKVFLELYICYSLNSKLVVRYTHFSLSLSLSLFFFFFFAYLPLTISVLPVFQKWNIEKQKRPHLSSIVLRMEGWGVTRKIRYCPSFYYELKKKNHAVICHITTECWKFISFSSIYIYIYIKYVLYI